MPVRGANGPPGLSHRADGQVLNCGYSVRGRMPLVETNDALIAWLSAPSGPKPHRSPVNGSSSPAISKRLPSSSNPSATATAYAPSQYSSTSITPSLFGEPNRPRQRRPSKAGFGAPAMRQGPSPFGS